MAVYGIDYYGVARFGRDPLVQRPDFSVEPFRSTPLDYQSLHMTWVRPSSTDCVYLRLVRNNHNLPQDENDGLPLWGDTTTTPTYMDSVLRVPGFTDTGLGPGFSYYSMFGWSTSENLWIRCSDLIGLVPVQYGYGDRFYNLLPMAYRDRDYVMVDPFNPWPVDGSQPPLKRYLALLGFEMDFIRSELESLRSLNDPMNCSGAVLPLLAQQFGLVHEPEIGMQQERQLIQNAVHLYKYKGSPRGITEFASIMTSYGTVLAHHGYNCLLTLDDSIMAESTGTWQAWPPAGTRFPSITGNSGLDLTYNPNMMPPSPTAVPGMTNPLEVYPTGFTPKTLVYNNSGMAVSATGTNIIASTENRSFEGGTTGTWTAGANTAISNQPQGSVGTHSMGITASRGGLTQSQAILTSTPVTAGQTYIALADFRSVTNNRQVEIAIQFFTSGGTSLGLFTGTPQVETSSDWVTASVVATAPATSATVTITLNILTPANTEMHLVDNIRMGIGGTDVYITTGGIPITDFMSSTCAAGTATFRIQVWSSSATPRQVELSLWGDNGSGTPIPIAVTPSSATPQFTETPNHWTMMTVTGTINPYPGSVPGDSKPTGPASYYWIYPRVRILGVLTGTHYITLAGLWPCAPADIGVNTPDYDYPRDVKIVLQPQSSNLLSNPITTFQRPNPSYNPTLPPGPTNEPGINIGLDGLSNAVDPTAPTGALTSAAMSVRYQTTEDQPQSIAVHGTAALQVNAGGPDATIWFGRVVSWSTPAPDPNGWFATARTSGPTYMDGHRNDWYFGDTQGAPDPRNWFDPIHSFWFEGPQQYYATGDPNSWVKGIWFSPPSQPTYYGNLTQFTVVAGQSFNFSVWARYVTVLDPSNAHIEMGLRWYYPDNTWIECWGVPNASYGYDITATYPPGPYSVPPQNLQYTFLGDPPPESNTGVLPIGVFPFVRFTRAQDATFLLNGAMLSPGVGLNPFFDNTTYPESSGDFLVDPVSNASYIYRRRIPRTTRLNAELYRWLPAGSTYNLVLEAGAVQPPLDPTLW